MQTDRFQALARWAALASAFAAAASAEVALGHMRLTAELGPICGLGSGHADHCWACYAAPLLAMTAMISARAARAKRLPLLARIRR